MRVEEVGPGRVDEFFRYGGPSVFPCGCSASDAVRVSAEEAGSDAYPMGEGVDREDIEEFEEMSGEPLVVWWHNCPERENIVLRSCLGTFPH